MQEHQSLATQSAEVSFRKLAAFGEPEKVLAATTERIAARRAVLKNLQSRGVKLSPFLEIGADIGSTTLLLENEFASLGAASDISRDSLKEATKIAEHYGYSKIPFRICCDARTLPFVDGAFRFVYCFVSVRFSPH